jgi:hypothetical protein
MVGEIVELVGPVVDFRASGESPLPTRAGPSPRRSLQVAHLRYEAVVGPQPRSSPPRHLQRDAVGPHPVDQRHDDATGLAVDVPRGDADHARLADGTGGAVRHLRH